MSECSTHFWRFFFFFRGSVRFVCLPQKIQPPPSTWPLLAYAAFSFVSISLFFPLPLLLLLLPPLLNINLFCFPSHWSPVPFPTILSSPLITAVPLAHHTFSPKPTFGESLKRIHRCRLFLHFLFYFCLPTLSDFYLRKYLLSACPPVCLSLCVPVPSGNVFGGVFCSSSISDLFHVRGTQEVHQH